MKVISQNSDKVVGAYVCPDGFISQVVYFSLKPDATWFEGMLSNEVGRENVNPRDIRVAARHGWELGAGARDTIESRLGRGGVVHEIYWTRYPKTETQTRQGVSLCLGDASRMGCLRIFIHDKDSAERFCPSCKKKYGV